MKKISLLFIAFLPIFSAFCDNKENTSAWGVGAMYLGVTRKNPISPEEMRNDKTILLLKHFYRIGGENLPATPTECKITHTADTLYVMFCCKESNMDFPAISHKEDWFSLLGSPVEQDAAFPDKVDLFLSPEMSKLSYYHFAATIDGQIFAGRCNERQELQDADGSIPKRKNEKITGFKAIVVKKKEKGEWIVLMSIPWKTIGGKPAYFGLTPVRTRWRNSEVSSPVALDFSDRPVATDLFIETHFGSKPRIDVTNRTLCRLPSGTLRWQRPASLIYPDIKKKKEIGKLQESLHQPTTVENLSGRLSAIQHWVNLMELEGFNFGSTRGSLPDEDMYLSQIREEINFCLQKNNLDSVCRLADDYLAKLDNMSRKWFADGSPGNIRSQEWTPVEELVDAELKDTVFVMHCKAGDQLVDLYLSMPETGGIRIHSGKQGFFKPSGLCKLQVGDMDAYGSYMFRGKAGNVMIRRNPFEINLSDTSGNPKLQISGRHIAFRFLPGGKIVAADVNLDMETEDVIFGFGERFDRFNRNGDVLTLWGMDDWLGLTTGLQNQSYKPVPVFHNAGKYMIFINSSYRLRADVGRTEAGRLRLSQHGDVFDYYFWTCRPEEALQSYTSLTGKPALFPRWAFEPWMGRTGRGWRNTPLNNPVEEKKQVIRRFEELDIPHSAVYAEGVGAESPELHAFAASRGIKVLSWFFSSVPLKRQKELMPEKEELPVLPVNNPSGYASRNIDYIDFSHPNAPELSRRWWKLRLDLGVAGSMVDFGDRVPEDVVFFDGRKGDEMHNFYAYDYHRTYANVFSERRGDDFILFGRSAAPGAQQWTAQFSGDLRSNFKGLQGGLNGMLNLCSGGFSTWGSDLGGFRAWPEPTAYMRWTQFSCFSPLMRCHGRTPREPWEYGEMAVTNYKYYAWVRENLLEYIHYSAAEAHRTGLPMIRSMAVAFPEQLQLAGVTDQYMFGNGLMACPVVTDDSSRVVRFPVGRWTNLWNGSVIKGPCHSEVNASIYTIPVYLRQGAMIPVRLNRRLQFGESMTGDCIHALILIPADGEEIRYGNQKAIAKVIAKNGGFEVLLDDCPEIRYLLIYASHVAEVRAGGDLLPSLKDHERESPPPGWYFDKKMNRTVIRMPDGISRRVEIKISEDHSYE
ncbi:MAG: hypothetical protein LBG28_04485 [Tannerella sp.]|nr:hypothetical protein [Tannerella sp.]